MFMHTKNIFIVSALLMSIGFVSCRKDDGFSHNPSQPIAISSFAPAVGPLGSEILIKGSNFTTDTSKIKVSINGIPLLVVGVKGDEIMAVITTKTGSGPLKVDMGSETGSSAGAFTYTFSYTVSTLAGSGQAAFNDGTGTAAAFNFNGVRGQLSVDNDLNVYVADGGNQRVRKITADGVVTTIAGSGINGYQDGSASSAQFNNPCGTAVDKDGNVYVSERNGRNIRKITPDGVVSTYAHGDGNGGNELTSVVVNNTTGEVLWSDFYGDGIYHLKNGNVEKAINHSLPCTITMDAQGVIYATHYDDQQVWKYTPKGDGTYDGVAIAGVSHQGGKDDGPGSSATFARPWGIALDSKNNLFVTGQGGGDASNSVRMITAGVWDVRTIAGVGDSQDYYDGLGADARFRQPTGVAVDKNDNVYILDMGNNRIRKITVQ
jgi:sugar lactone lactonase YvrE